MIMTQRCGYEQPQMVDMSMRPGRGCCASAIPIALAVPLLSEGCPHIVPLETSPTALSELGG